MYFVLKTRSVKDKPLVSNVEPRFAPDGWRMGKPLGNEFAGVSMTLNTFSGIADIWRDGQYLAVRRELAAAIENVGERNIECYPLRLTSVDEGHDDESFVLVHPYNPVYCIDFQKGDYTLWDETSDIQYFKRMVIDETTIPPDRHYFQPGHCGTMIMISERLKWEMSKIGCEGARFVPTDEYSE